MSGLYIPKGNTAEDLEEAKRCAETELRAAREVLTTVHGSGYFCHSSFEQLALISLTGQLISMRMMELRTDRVCT